MESKNAVPILEKALDIMEYIGASPEPVSLPELWKTLGIPQPSCYRIVTTLVRRKWLDKRSGNRYDIAGGLSAVADKTRLRLEKYKKLQPAMNRIANMVGFSVKCSVRDGDEFVNVCSAKNLSGLLTFSEPGFRFPLREPASVSTVFLAEDTPEEQKRILGEANLKQFKSLLGFYRKNKYCFFKGSSDKDAEYPFDTLSFPLKRDNELLGVISLLSLPGSLEKNMASIAEKIEKPLEILSEMI